MNTQPPSTVTKEDVVDYSQKEVRLCWNISPGLLLLLLPMTVLSVRLIFAQVYMKQMVAKAKAQETK